MTRFSHPNILKLGKSELAIRIRKTYHWDILPPCPSNSPSSPFNITFLTIVTRRFLDPCGVSLSSLLNSSPIISECGEAVDEKTIWQDGRLFFKLQERNNSKAAVKTALRSLKVRKSRHGKIFKEIMAYERRYNKDRKEKKKKKALKGLVFVQLGESLYLHQPRPSMKTFFTGHNLQWPRPCTFSMLLVIKQYPCSLIVNSACLAMQGL
ncbi:hypothetical protein POM88_011907 [Heracleum sosnowskyi]|uniref:Uncharacterized protein n=1 Tax=Heracleum sosnowskyi TaxID=360622 RepID=A0AAD8N1R0_9APIA|nr:hypothetical protein POM88_011907 [Heracleum sosnowskyi]